MTEPPADSQADSQADPHPARRAPADRSALPDLRQLPAAGSAGRWPLLQRLRRAPSLDLEPWLQAVEAGRLAPEPDLLQVLAERLDGAASVRLLAWWLADPAADPALLAVIGRCRHPRSRDLLWRALTTDALPAERRLPLLPLLGHQRHPPDGAWLLEQALAPLPLARRRAALEGLAVGLSAWPLPPLRRGLPTLVLDLDPALAATALDLLARLPGGRRELASLDRRRLAPPLVQRLERRLAAPGLSAGSGGPALRECPPG